MTREDLIITVCTILNQEFAVPIVSVDWGTNLEELNLDSLDLLKLAVALEKEYNIKIQTPELVQIQTFGDIIRGLEEKLGSK